MERDGNMNKKELIERIEGLKNIFGNECEYVKIDFVIELASELDELEAGRADEAPRYVKNILARLRELPLHDREVWLKTIMGEFEQDFSRAKWREGYEQGKLEGILEREKVTIPKFMADWYEEHKDDFETNLFRAVDLIPSDYEEGELSEFEEWLVDEHTAPFQTLVNMHQFGYTVEKEKRYRVKMKKVGDISFLNHDLQSDSWLINDGDNGEIFKTHHTRKELEEAGFGWVFDCPGVEIEEVE